MKKLYLYLFSASFVLFIGIALGTNLISAEQNLLQEKCTKCHSLKIPDNYTKAEWKYNVERMAKRAGLSSQETQSIIDLNKKK